MRDPPEHNRLRALVSKVFHPRAIQNLEPMVRSVIGGFADELDGRDHFDAVEELAAPFPVEIISRVLGVPEQDHQQIRLWIDVMLHREPGHNGPTAEGAEAAFAYGLYFYELAGRSGLVPATTC